MLTKPFQCLSSSILYLICAIVNILLGFAGGQLSRQSEVRFIDSLRSLLCVWWSLLLNIGCATLLLVPIPVRRPFDYVQASAYVSFKYALKWARGNLKRWMMRWHRKLQEADQEHAPVSGDLPRIRNCLPAELTLMIFQHLHYVDLVNLARSSSKMRVYFFGNENPLHVIQSLRRYACSDKPNQTCAVCDVQMCSVRYKTRNIRSLTRTSR